MSRFRAEPPALCAATAKAQVFLVGGGTVTTPKRVSRALEQFATPEASRSSQAGAFRRGTV